MILKNINYGNISLSKMKTFAVNSTVIFVTEVIFLGFYCTFFVMTHTNTHTNKNQHLDAFLRR